MSTGKGQARKVGLLSIHQAFIDVYSIPGTVLGPRP